MTTPDPAHPEPGRPDLGRRRDPARSDPAPPDPARPDPFGPTRQGWLERRREKIAEEIARNRRGEYTVPTWVLAAALVVFVAGWVALVILA